MSASYQCQFCRAPVALADVNVANDIALCRACGKTMSFSEIAPIPDVENIDLTRPPKGVRIEESPMHGKTIIYRKIPLVVIFLIPFTAVWSGFSMFGIYGSQIKEGRFNPIMSLFGLPFFIGSVCLVSFILFCLFGRWRIGYSGGVLSAAMEVGPIGWTRRLVCDKSARVRIRPAKWQNSNVPQRLIQVECQGSVLKFGTPIPDEAKDFIAEAVRRTIIQG